MLGIFKYVGGLLTALLKMWQGIELGGFRPFWYLVGLGLLTIFGFFLRGLLFSGAGGESISKLATGKKKNNSGSKVIIINNRKK
jgi:hypothetical protein